MFKQQVSGIKRVLTILLAVLFVVSLTAAASSAESYPHQPPSSLSWRVYCGHSL